MKTITRMFLAASTMLFLYSCDPEDISAESSEVLIDDVRSETGNQEGDIDDGKFERPQEGDNDD